MRARYILPLAAALLLAWPAQAMRPPVPPAPLAPPASELPESAVSDAWTLTCSGGHLGVCTVAARFLRLRAADRPTRVTLDTSPALAIDRVTVDGQPATLDPDGRLTLSPGSAPATIELTGVAEAGVEAREGWVMPAVQARHLACHVGRKAARFTFDVLPAAARTDTYDLGVQLETTGVLRGETFTGPGEPGQRRPERVELRRPAAPLHFGGPMVGLGATTGDDGRFTLRLGVEAGASSWALMSLAFDSDFHGRNVLAPQLEASTPTLVFVPMSFVAGVGLPVQLGEDSRVGARFNVGVHFLALGLVTSFDLWPGRAGDQADVTVMALFTL
ncbi:MAG: hypothetical protein H6746_05140 [Deltaproteobacteria bacterium]|nr:hypothetical protein [Deltaproteobacteria bacterium]